MSDTPRTDAALWREGTGPASECVTAEFARDLERENARLREAIKTCCDAYHKTKWGNDGDCGTSVIIDTLEKAAENTKEDA